MLFCREQTAIAIKATMDLLFENGANTQRQLVLYERMYISENLVYESRLADVQV